MVDSNVMVILTRAAWRAPRISALALVLTLGSLPAKTDASSIWAAHGNPGASLLSGFQECGPALDESITAGRRCLAGWSVDHLLLDAATRLATDQGQALFGEHFHIVNSMSYSPSGSGLIGGLDVVMPLLSSTSPNTEPKLGAFFLQQGVTRWVDSHGSSRNDIRFGAVRRFGLSDAGGESGVFGVSTFVQQSQEYHHTRLVAGGDYTGKWGRGSLNLFLPTTGWQRSHRGYEERALAGIELGLRFDLTTTVSISTAIGQWEKDDGLGGWSTNGRMAVGWRPHSWLDVGVAWNGLGMERDEKVFRLAFSMPFGGRRKTPEWEGFGLVGGSPTPSAIDPWSPVDNINVIQVASRKNTADQLVSAASVRFLQDSALSGDQIGLEVSLPAVTPSDLDVVVTLAPGSGDNPAVPGVDYIDEPISVTIQAGTSSTVVTVQLPLNADLNEARSLSATVTLAS